MKVRDKDWHGVADAAMDMHEQMSIKDPWYKFECQNCHWETVGNFNFNHTYENDIPLPDTDCPKCGFHDSVIDHIEPIVGPYREDWSMIVLDQNTGPYAK